MDVTLGPLGDRALEVLALWVLGPWDLGSGIREGVLAGSGGGQKC